MDCVFSANVVQTVLSLRLLFRGHHPQQWAHSQGEGAALIGSTVYRQPAGRKGCVFSLGWGGKAKHSAHRQSKKGDFCFWGGGDSKHS